MVELVVSPHEVVMYSVNSFVVYIWFGKWQLVKQMIDYLTLCLTIFYRKQVGHVF